MQNRYNKAEKIFDKHVSGNNFMSPEILAYGHCWNQDYVFEISRGNGIFSRWIYGITIVHKTDGHDHDRSSSFVGDDSRKLYNECIAYAKSIT